MRRVALRLVQCRADEKELPNNAETMTSFVHYMIYNGLPDIDKHDKSDMKRIAHTLLFVRSIQRHERAREYGSGKVCISINPTQLSREWCRGSASVFTSCTVEQEMPVGQSEESKEKVEVVTSLLDREKAHLCRIMSPETRQLSPP